MDKVTTVGIDLAKRGFALHGVDGICEAVNRPNMRFVPVQSAEQQAVLALHRVRQGWIEERSATINRLRALLTEFGVVLPKRAQHVRRGALAAAESLPALAPRALQDLRRGRSMSASPPATGSSRPRLGKAKRHNP